MADDRGVPGWYVDLKILREIQNVKIFNIRFATMKSTDENRGCSRGFYSFVTSAAGGIF